MSKKVYRITWGTDDEVTGLIWAESRQEVADKMKEIGWPVFSFIGELHILELGELDELRKQIKEEGL